MQSSSWSLALKLPISDPGEEGFPARFPQRERLGTRSEQRPLPPCAGSAKILDEAVLSIAYCRGH